MRRLRCAFYPAKMPPVLYLALALVITVISSKGHDFMRRIALIFSVLLMLGVVAACRPSANSQVPQIPQLGGDAIINWPRNANHIVFQIDVIGGQDTFSRRNDIPLCTIYGDNRIVWTDTGKPNEVDVLFDVLEDIQIYNFVSDLSVNYAIYGYQSRAAVQLPSEEQPYYEQIILNVNDVLHVTDGFESWRSNLFRDVLNECITLSGRPALYEPEGAWLSAQYVEQDMNATIITWNEAASGLSLSGLADSEAPVWVDNENLPILWNIMTRTPSYRQFRVDDQFFELALQVPNVHRQSPPAPTANELEDARRIG